MERGGWLGVRYSQSGSFGFGVVGCAGAAQRVDALGQVLGQGVQAFGAQQVHKVLVGEQFLEALHHQEQPLVGMLGTLLGMLETFQKVSEQGGFTGPAQLTAGVFTALITSVLGLTVAVPMYLFYLYFLGRAKRLVHRIERAGIEMVHLIADAREEDEFAPFRGEVTAGRKHPKSKPESAK